MADIAVYHPDVERGGGAEAVCLHIIDALAPEHDVTLLTGRHPDLSVLDDRYGTTTAGMDINLLGPIVDALIDGRKYNELRNAIYAREVQRRADTYDGVVSAYGELTVPDGALQYVHHPMFRCPSSPEQSPRRFGRVYDTIVRAVAQFDPAKGTMLTNSEWMASVLAGCRDVQPNVVYPPVMTEDFIGQSWAERENSFVTVGRIARDKQTKLALDIFNQVREAGHDMTLHLVGKAGEGQYATDVLDRVSKLDHVVYHGEVSRDKLVSLLESVRYGLHTKQYEHFGMVVAEMVAAGMIPFVPDSGGQVEIVGNLKQLVYRSPQQAVNKIQTILGSSTDQERLLEALPDPASRYGKERFAREIRAQTALWLDSK